MHSAVPPFIAKRIRQQASFDCISKDSTPVPFFGNIEKARVATLSLNPSHDEFYHKGRLLIQEGEKRLESLVSLKAGSLEQLTDAQVQTVYDSCKEYYGGSGKPYWPWFRPMQNLLANSLGVQYGDGSCCHTDIVQWATNPKWRMLDSSITDKMLSTDLSFLKELLGHSNVSLIVMNGSTTVKRFRECFCEELGEVNDYCPTADGKGLKLFTGTVHLNGRLAHYFGWSRYIHYGLRADRREVLCAALRSFGVQALST